MSPYVAGIHGARVCRPLGAVRSGEMKRHQRLGHHHRHHHRHHHSQSRQTAQGMFQATHTMDLLSIIVPNRCRLPCAQNSFISWQRVRIGLVRHAPPILRQPRTSTWIAYSYLSPDSVFRAEFNSTHCMCSKPSSTFSAVYDAPVCQANLRESPQAGYLWLLIFLGCLCRCDA
jgi:hypothetical protein